MSAESRQSQFSKRKAPRQPRSRATVDSICIAATEMARTQGFASLNTIDIAARAGVSVGSLYQYFPNRESIFLSLYEETTASLVVAIKAKFPQILDAPLEKAVRMTATEMLTLYKQNQLILIDLPQQMPELKLSGQPLSFDQLLHGSLRLFLAHRNLGESPARIEHKAFFIENILIGSIQRYLSKPPARLPAKDFLDHLIEIVIDCVKRPAAARSGTPSPAAPPRRRR